MGSSQQDIPEKQAGGQSWPAVKRTTLGNSQADTHGHPSRGHLWETIKRTFETIKRALMGNRSTGHPWETIKRTFMTRSQKHSPGKQSSVYSWPPVNNTPLENNRAYIRGASKRTILENSQANTHGYLSRGHPQETLRREFMASIDDLCLYILLVRHGHPQKINKLRVDHRPTHIMCEDQSQDVASRPMQAVKAYQRCSTNPRRELTEPAQKLKVGLGQAARKQVKKRSENKAD